MVITLQVETLITAITSTMDESKKVERELVAIQERQVHHQLDNSIKIDDEKSTRM